jgi:membrane protease YdiL (CAAX protease family)
MAAVGAGAVLLAIRKESWRDLGLHAGGDARFVISRAAEFSILALVTGFAVIGLATALGYPPSQSAVLTQQPESLSGFLLDIVFGVWIGAAIGEELFFRGLLLTKFTTLFGGGRLALVLAILSQAIWFGAGHVSQGASGMIMAGTIGAVVGTYFVTRGRRALIPLMIGHGFVDTVSQTIYFDNKRWNAYTGTLANFIHIRKVTYGRHLHMLYALCTRPMDARQTGTLPTGHSSKYGFCSAS